MKTLYSSICHLYPVCDCCGADPLPGMQGTVYPVHRAAPTLIVTNLNLRVQILLTSNINSLRYLDQCYISSLNSGLFTFL